MTFDPTEPDLSPDEVEDLVDERIASEDVVLFMKGDARMPQCGYSKKAVALLQQYLGPDGVETVDTLQNLEAFREALNEHSGWETIPQTFVDGEFIGGSDILEELHERGELAEKLGVDPDSVEFGGDASGGSSGDVEAPF
ncbi:glutaredoxin [Halovenus sp. WSH3]|uniref:Glutaredoxin n=1 Tax=Halovenus carboxidivorans TaxID=2692199 RepID=A0A6B0T4E8_9EURY|nr:glutaredoxin domain-containing protein [Halovenus carboxidivorans]MXR50373.1 glutaredoxin [Halovenus carboxidivorans]